MSKLSNIMPDSKPLVRGTSGKTPVRAGIRAGKKGPRILGTRIIQGLITAAPCERPGSIPESRTRHKAKRAGLNYERDLAGALPSGCRGQWFAFVDSNGPGYCQTDVLLEGLDWVAVLEAKYTWTAQGHVQVDRLYRPVLQKALKKKALGLVVAKVLTTQLDLAWVCRDLESALHRASLGLPTVLHWLGTSLGPLQLPAPLSHLASESATR